MAKNKFSKKFKATPDKAKWNEICPPNEYRVLSADDAMTLGIVPTGMTEVNTVIVGASGSTDSTIMYFANYFRVDKDDLDQEPYFELFESGSTQSGLYGIFHHADFDGRTEPLSTEDLARIAASGSTTEIQFTAKPDKPSGTLFELRDEGKLNGFNFTWIEGTKKKGNN